MDKVFIEQLSNSISFEMILVEGGMFEMGSSHDTAYKREKPVHKVKLTDFWIGKYPVSQSLWKAIMGTENNPSFFQGDLRPVEMISWDDCQEFLKKLNTLTHKTYRLPTEAEWEYAAKGGKYSQGFLYSGSNKQNEVGWFDENSDEETKEVGLKQSNELGIFGMSGNIWEWCQEWYSTKYYEECFNHGEVKNPKGPDEGELRVVRGGSWCHGIDRCRTTSRTGYQQEDLDSFLGFRLVYYPPFDGIDS